MAIPKPEGLEARHEAAWAYLTVPVKRGHGQELESKNVGEDWTPAHKQGAEFMVPMQQGGKPMASLWRARYTRTGNAGEWTLGKVWMPDGFQEGDDEEPVKPERPYGLQAALIGGEFTQITWAEPAKVPDSWIFAWRKANTKTWSTKKVLSGQVEIGGNRRHYKVRDLSYYTDYEITVKAVIGEQVSDAARISVVTTHRTDGEPGPADPTDAEASNISNTSALVTWDQSDPRAVKYWRFGIPGLGPIEDVEGQEHEVTGLKPDTEYTAQIWATGHDKSMSGGFATATFTTAGGGPSPFPDPPKNARVVSTDVLAGTGRVAWDTGGRAEFWKVLLENVWTSWRTVHRNDFMFRGLEAGQTYGWRVRSVRVDGEGVEQESAPVRGPAIVMDDQPDPKPEPPTGLRSHCVTDTTAKLEWDDEPSVEKWIVFLDGDQSNILETVSNLCRVKNLLPGTDYSAQVIAVKNGVESEPSAPHEFPTLDTILPPDDPDIGNDLPAPSGLMVTPEGADGIRGDWIEGRPDVGKASQFYAVSLDGVEWQQVYGNSFVFTDLEPGQHTVHVYGVIDAKLTGIARASATTMGAAQ